VARLQPSQLKVAFRALDAVMLDTARYLQVPALPFPCSLAQRLLCHLGTATWLERTGHGPRAAALYAHCPLGSKGAVGPSC
jgi:hypothetical protein